MDKTSSIPFNVPALGDEEITAAVDVLRSGWITTWDCAAKFEREFATYTGARHALALNSATAGMHLALAALGIGPGDEVITTPLTFCATVNTILEVGATPVFADIGADLNISPTGIRESLTPRTRAVMPVHIAGLPCDMNAIGEIAQERNLNVIEDAAHAAGASYRDVRIGGSNSDVVVFSFYATKNLTTGEGGMATTPSPDLEHRMRMLCLHGINRDAWNRYSAEGSWYYEVIERGFKYNMSDILAAIGREQLRKLDAMNSRRAEIAAQFSHAFVNMPELEVPQSRADCQHAWHLYILRLNLDLLTIDRARFIDQMKSLGIGCSVHFIPIPMHPFYRRTLTFRDPCEHALAEYPRLISLPIYPGLTHEEVERIIDAVKEVVHRSKRKVQSLRVESIVDGESVLETVD